MTYAYDAVGNRTKRIDYNGKATTYEYDVLNRLKKINYLVGGDGTAIGTTATYTYDDLSRLLSAVNENGTVSFTYDNRGRVATTTDVNGRAITYTYDAASNRTLMKLINANHSTYVYDAANRLTTLTDEAKKNFTFAYDNADRLTTKTLPNTVATTYAYDGMSRLTRLKDAKGTTTLFDRNYSYDPANQISQIAEISQTRIFSYDNLDRLTQMTNGVSNENYVFDSVGNRTASHRSATHSYQPYNQMTATSNATMSYDANGNMISRSQGAWTYVWDHENRMKSAASGATSVAYAYDALGRRVRRTQGTQITKFTYDGLDVVMDDVNGTLTKYQNGPGIDNKLKLVTGTTSRYFVSDHLGSTNALTSSTGAILEQTSYDSFGNASNTSFSSRYQFTGREYDSLTGFHYYRNRWYDANIGRFISEDPIGFAGGDNWYTYVGNEPLAFTDPLGLGPFRLPPNPGPNGSNLPPGWKPAPGHKNPGGERWISPGGDEGLDFHPGKNGGKGFDGEDHWHKLKPKRGGGFEKDKTGGRKGGHFRPGDEVDLKECSPGRLPKTAFEFQLDEQYHREMEKFWGKILGGSLIGGAVLLGGGPALGGFAGEAAGGAAAGSGGFPWWLPAFGF